MTIHPPSQHPLVIMLSKKWPFYNIWLVQKLFCPGCFSYLSHIYREGPIRAVE